MVSAPARDGGLDRFGPMVVHGDLAAPHVRLLDDGVHLLLRKLLAADAVAMGEHPARAHELDHVRPVLDVLAHLGPERPGAVSYALVPVVEIPRQQVLVRMAAGGAQRRPGDLHARPRHLPRVDPVPQRHVGKAAGPHVAYAGEAGQQGLPRIGHPVDRLPRRGDRERVRPALFRVGGQMHVHVDQPGQHRRARQIDHVGARRNLHRIRAAHGRDLPALHQDHLVGQHLAGRRIDQPAGADRRHPARRILRPRPAPRQQRSQHRRARGRPLQPHACSSSLLFLMVSPSPPAFAARAAALRRVRLTRRAAANFASRAALPDDAPAACAFRALSAGLSVTGRGVRRAAAPVKVRSGAPPGRFALFLRSGVRYTPAFRRRSSVVERILGKAEVQSSNLCGGTSFDMTARGRGFALRAVALMPDRGLRLSAYGVISPRSPKGQARP